MSDYANNTHEQAEAIYNELARLSILAHAGNLEMSHAELGAKLGDLAEAQQILCERLKPEGEPEKSSD